MTNERLDDKELRVRHIRNLELFVVRARRVKAHSLSNIERLQKLRQGSMTLGISETEQYVIIDLPPEEQVESLAARVRPTILEEEDTYWAKALEAIGYLGPNANTRAKDVRKNLKNGWKDINDKAAGIRGYGMYLKD